LETLSLELQVRAVLLLGHVFRLRPPISRKVNPCEWHGIAEEFIISVIVAERAPQISADFDVVTVMWAHATSSLSPLMATTFLSNQLILNLLSSGVPDTAIDRSFSVTLLQM
jgi:hypothetical protein